MIGHLWREPFAFGCGTSLHFGADQRALQLAPGYGGETLRRADSERFPVRHRVGARSLTLSSFLGAFLAQDRLRIVAVEEYDSALQRWDLNPSDGRVVPWNLAVVARATSDLSVGHE